MKKLSRSPEELDALRKQQNEKRRFYYQTHKEEEKLKRKEYRLRHPIEARDRQKEWYRDNKEYAQKRNKETYSKLKLEVFSHYAINNNIECYCCGEKILGFLTIDHANNDGAAHRKSRSTGKQIYYTLKKDGFPQYLNLRIACYNCNCASYRNNNICPHKG